MPETRPYWVYIVRCNDDTLYTGICRDLKARIHTHNTSPKGAKYTRSRRPVKLVYSMFLDNKSQALREEARIKSLTRAAKLSLISQTHATSS